MHGLVLSRDALVALALAIGNESALGVVVDILGVAFALSGFQKVGNPLAASFAFVDYGVATKARPSLGLILGAAELSLGGWLLLRVAAPAAAAAACIVLLFFTYLLTRELRSDRRHPCYCFGASDTALSGTTVARAAGLAAVAAAAMMLAPWASPSVLAGTKHLLVAVALVASFVLLFAQRELVRLNVRHARRATS